MKFTRLSIRCSVIFLFSLEVGAMMVRSEPRGVELQMVPHRVEDSPEIKEAEAALHAIRHSLLSISLKNHADVQSYVSGMTAEFANSPRFVKQGEVFTVLHAHAIAQLLRKFLATVIHIDEMAIDEDVRDSVMGAFVQEMRNFLVNNQIVATSEPQLRKTIVGFDDLSIGFPAHELRMFYLLAHRKFGCRLAPPGSTGIFVAVVSTIGEHHRKLHQLVSAFGLPTYSHYSHVNN